MSDFKIIGNPNPVIGTEEFYSVSNPVAKTFPYTTAPKSPFDTPVIWTVHILEHGRWRKTKENDKKGDKVSYTFLQRSLGRKGIRIMATRGDQTARIDIDTHPAERPKVDSIDLLDKSGRKPAKPLSYGQTLKARVHCLHMEKRKIFVTLWEDDAKGAGHNKANEKNIIETRFGFVENGIADIDFLLRPTFAKIATKGGEEKDKIHEYYVTTSFDNKKLASKNVNVNELETPVAPFKRKVPVQQPVKNIPAQQPKAQSPTVSQTKPKGAINSVYISDDAGNAIKGTYRNKQIKVWINSSGLIGREIQLRLYDEDYWGNDLLADQKCTITNNIFSITVALNEIPRSSGGDFGEGAEQEVFADIEVLETNKHTVSAIVDVDATVFKSDPVSDSNSVFKVFQPEKKDDKKENDKPKLVIFPLLVKPENDKENKWGKERNWTAKQGANMTTFNSNRNHGKRKHAARDLYTNALETVVAIADGIVLDIKPFYCETNQVTVRHTLKDGRDFIIRYGELDPKSISVKIGQKVTQKQELGKTGKLLKYLKKEKKAVPLMEINDTIVYMLHFEHFIGSLKFDLDEAPLSDTSKPYNRRGDLIDSLSILQEGYNNSFGSKPTINKDEIREFTEHDARLALMKIYDLYGKEMAQTIESIYRWEGKHFKSDQYKICGSPGMEVSGNNPPPNYGWDGSLYKKNPEYTPIGIWESFENKGKSGAGGNDQDTKNKKKYIKFPSVEAGMMYIVDFINRHDGNVGRWHSTDKKIQENYTQEIKTAIPRIVNQF